MFLGCSHYCWNKIKDKCFIHSSLLSISIQIHPNLPLPGHLLQGDIKAFIIHQKMWLQSLPNDWAPHPLSKGVSSHPSLEDHFHNLILAVLCPHHCRSCTRLSVNLLQPLLVQHSLSKDSTKVHITCLLWKKLFADVILCRRKCELCFRYLPLPLEITGVVRMSKSEICEDSLVLAAVCCWTLTSAASAKCISVFLSGLSSKFLQPMHLQMDEHMIFACEEKQKWRK